jgi:oligopeptide transport system permease protein
MFAFVLRRFFSAVPTLFLIVTISFFLMRVAPGGPFNQERGLHPVVKANLERQYNLDQPLWKQYLHYLNDLFHFDLGPSYVLPDFTVAELFRAGLPISMQLGGSALILALLVGGLLGIVAALRQNQPADYSVIAVATAGSTIPTFVIAPLLQLVFGLWLGLWLASQSWPWSQLALPVGGWGGGALRHKIMPIITLALPQIAIVARLMRGSMIESLRSHHIRTARAMGLSDFSVVVKHALRGAILPIVSYAGPAAAALLTGSIIVETIFSIPGIGRYFVEGALNRDYTLVMGTVVVIAVFTILFNLIVDILYATIDPRVRYD